MPSGQHEHVKEYKLNELKDDTLNDKLFGFVQLDIETPEHLKEKFHQSLKMQKLNLRTLVSLCRITTKKKILNLIKVIN